MIKMDELLNKMIALQELSGWCTANKSPVTTEISWETFWTENNKQQCLFYLKKKKKDCNSSQ